MIKQTILLCLVLLLAVQVGAEQLGEKERISFGSHVGESAYVTNKDGIGTSKATIAILMDWDREVRACSDEYLNYRPIENVPIMKDRDGYARCIQYAKDNFKGPRMLTAQANCQTGEMRGFYETKSRFYTGQIRSEVEATDYIKGGVFYSHVFEYGGFRVPDYSATGVQTDGEVFRVLCPTSFTEAPKSSPAELDLHLDCKVAVEEASRIATSSGVGNLLNIRIVETWDVKSEGDTWYSSKCSANVTFNNGEEAKLIFEQVPRHGKYFLQTTIVPGVR